LTIISREHRLCTKQFPEKNENQNDVKQKRE